MEYLVGIVIAVLSGIVLWALYRLFPPRQMDHALPPGTDVQVLARKFRTLEIGLGLLACSGFCVWTPIAFFVFHAIGGLFARQLGESEILLTPLPLLWSFPAFLAALFLTVLTVETIGYRVLGERKAEYFAMRKLRGGWLAHLSSWHFYVGCLLPSLVVAYLLMDTYAVFRADEMVINPLSGLRARHYAYSDVDRILSVRTSAVPNGTEYPDWRFVVGFRDTYQWNRHWDPSCPSEGLQRQIAAFVSTKSGERIEVVDALGPVTQP